MTNPLIKLFENFTISHLKMAGYEFLQTSRGYIRLIRYIRFTLVNYKSLNSPAYFILEFYCKPNCQVTKLSSYQIVKLPNCQVTKLLFTKLSSYQIVKLPNCQVTKLLVTKLLVTKLSSYQIIIHQNVCYQIITNNPLNILRRKVLMLCMHHVYIFVKQKINGWY